jgi:hypothetical protein
MNYEAVEKFKKDFDFHVSGFLTCCSFLQLTDEKEMKIVKKSCNILNRVNEKILSCDYMNEYKELIKFKKLRKDDDDE